MFSKCRHTFQFILFLILVFIAFSTASYWIQWTFIAATALVLLIIDIIFLNEDDFVYDPSYNHWKSTTERRLLEFEEDIIKLLLE